MRGPQLDTGSASPLYKQLMQRLRADIASGVYPVHSRIPSEQELGQTYHVSRVTVRKALGELTQEGLLERFQGRGTFVSIPRIHKDLRVINSFSDACRMMGCQPGTRVIRVQRLSAQDEDCRRLLCAPDAPLLEIMRLRLADNVPVMLEINRFPAAAFNWLETEALDQSLYALLSKRGMTPGQASHEVSLCYASPAEARLLEVEPGTALLRLDEVICDAAGQPLHTSSQRIRGDRFTFRI